MISVNQRIGNSVPEKVVKRGTIDASYQRETSERVEAVETFKGCWHHGGHHDWKSGMSDYWYTISEFILISKFRIIFNYNIQVQSIDTIPSVGKNIGVVLAMFAHGSVSLKLFPVVWIVLRSLDVICYDGWVLSECHKNYSKHSCLMNSQLTFLFLTNFNSMNYGHIV